ncbi:MAG: glycosyltransferase family 2 protein [Rhodobacteraceae bacterium]|nr:glycosyltransferase family 2 protein [Paracoccaceae bacterium]
MRDCEDTVGAAVMSALARKGPEIELIGVNDASMDNSVARFRAAVAGDDRATLLHQHPARGHCAAVGRALSQARGAQVLLLDPRARLEPGWRDILLADQKRHQADLVAGCPVFIWDGARYPRAPFLDAGARLKALAGPLTGADLALRLWPHGLPVLAAREVIAAAVAQFGDAPDPGGHLLLLGMLNAAQRPIYVEQPVWTLPDAPDLPAALDLPVLSAATDALAVPDDTRVRYLAWTVLQALSALEPGSAAEKAALAIHDPLLHEIAARMRTACGTSTPDAAAIAAVLAPLPDRLSLDPIVTLLTSAAVPAAGAAAETETTAPAPQPGLFARMFFGGKKKEPRRAG